MTMMHDHSPRHPVRYVGIDACFDQLILDETGGEALMPTWSVLRLPISGGYEFLRKICNLMLKTGIGLAYVMKPHQKSCCIGVPTETYSRERKLYRNRGCIPKMLP